MLSLLRQGSTTLQITEDKDILRRTQRTTDTRMVTNCITWIHGTGRMLEHIEEWPACIIILSIFYRFQKQSSLLLQIQEIPIGHTKVSFKGCQLTYDNWCSNPWSIDSLNLSPIPMVNSSDQTFKPSCISLIAKDLAMSSLSSLAWLKKTSYFLPWSYKAV